MRVIETFSGIGAQAKALSRAGIKHDIIATVEWDIHSIVAYDWIHNGVPVLDDLSRLSAEEKQEIRDELIEYLSNYTLSSNGKEPMTHGSLRRLTLEAMLIIKKAIERNNNLVSIIDVKATALPDNIDVLTYSFPCQDLSLGGCWHGNNSGIDRTQNNRSGLLWQIERILEEFNENDKQLPKFMLMENVTNIRSRTHIKDFNEWCDFLEKKGYCNRVIDLDASKFGIPQTRSRTFMISTRFDMGLSKEEVESLMNNLHDNLANHTQELRAMKEFLITDYSDPKILSEAHRNSPNNTSSRQAMENTCDILIDDNGNIVKSSIRTITTKQDRFPNSGIIYFKKHRKEGKANFRYLTARECFRLMGFDDEDYQRLEDGNFSIAKNKKFFSNEHLIRFAGNSIVVNILEAIFKEIDHIDKTLNK